MNQRNLLEVDWSKIPAPTDDGAAAHLVGMTIPPVSLIATDDTSVTLSALRGRTVVFAYPRTGEPGKIALVDDWDMIPGARGCTPQTCAFRDLFAELKAAGQPADEAAILADIKRRDERDRSRAVAPLVKAHDSKMLDTSKLDIEGAVAEAIRIVEGALPAAIWAMTVCSGDGMGGRIANSEYRIEN